MSDRYKRDGDDGATAVAGALLGAEYNVLDRLDLPVPCRSATSTLPQGALALIVVVVGTLPAAMAGGQAG